MKTITTEKARLICSYWHGGQWSALYQFCSSGVFIKQDVLHYLNEVMDCLQPEYAPYPRRLKKSEQNELNRLKRYFEKIAFEYGVAVEYIKHPVYRYKFPSLLTIVDFEVKPLRQAI